MIDEELTFEKYGYYSTDWKQHSCKRVVAVCDDCGAIRYPRKGDYTDLCAPCSQRRHHLLKEEDWTLKLPYIDDDITYSEKGYKSIWLKPGSSKLVWAICANPSCERKGGRGRWMQFKAGSELCHLCACRTEESHKNRTKIRGENHPLYGRHHTKETIENYRTSRMGENNSNWKGGITPATHNFRSSVAYAEWRTSVFERDDYTCQECGNSAGGKLNAHHILPYNDYREVEYSLNIDNGITLCEDCHKKIRGIEYEFVDTYQKMVEFPKGLSI